jgi:hypothetical protein
MIAGLDQRRIGITRLEESSRNLVFRYASDRSCLYRFGRADGHSNHRHVLGGALPQCEGGWPNILFACTSMDIKIDLGEDYFSLEKRTRLFHLLFNPVAIRQSLYHQDYSRVLRSDANPR